MSEQETNGISATFKAGRDFDAPWVVIRGASAEDVYGEVEKLGNDDAFLKAVATVAAGFHEIWIESGGSSATGGSTGGGQAPPQRSPGPQVGDPHPTIICDKCPGNPALTYQEWSTKAGKEYKAYRCPTTTFGHGFAAR